MTAKRLGICGRFGLGVHVLLAWATSVAVATAAVANPVLLYAPDSDEVLIAEDLDKPWFPASLTKLMTAYLTFEAVKSGKLDLEARVALSPYARSQPATRINLRVGIEPTVNQAVHAVILRSANDISVALAEKIAGTEEDFVRLMNTTAARLGMTRTIFANPHGLPEVDRTQMSTLRDFALLTRALLKDFPERADVFSARSILIHKGTFPSQNDLLVTVPGADGMKTGFTCGAGYNVVASATRGERRLIAIVFGAPDRVARSKKASELLETGFAHYDGSKPLAAVPTKLSATPVAALAIDTAEDASRKMRLRKCARPDPVPRTAPIVAAGGQAPVEKKVAAKRTTAKSAATKAVPAEKAQKKE